MINTQKRTKILYRTLDSPLLLLNKSCECLDCGGPLRKCIEDNCNIYTFEFARRQIPQHQLSVETEVVDTSPKSLINNSIKTSSGPQLLENSKIKVALEQPKRDNLKLNRLIEKVKKLQEKSFQISENIQLSAIISPSVSSPSPMNHRKTEISEIPLIQIMEVPSQADIISSKTPFISRVYNAFRNRSCPISTPLFQQSNPQTNNNGPILNFADGCRKAMIQEPEKQVSTCPSEHMFCDNQIRLKSLNDCLKNLLNGKKMNVFIKRKPLSKQKNDKKQISVYLRK